MKRIPSFPGSFLNYFCCCFLLSFSKACLEKVRVIFNTSKYQIYTKDIYKIKKYIMLATVTKYIINKFMVLYLLYL